MGRQTISDPRLVEPICCSKGEDMVRAHRHRSVLQVAILASAGASSLVMNGYYNLSRTYQRNTGGYSPSNPPSSILHLIGACLRSFQAQQSQQQDIQLPIFIRDPSPGQLVAACLIYGMAVNGYYYLHKGDRYQYWFAVCGAVSAFAVGWISKKDIHGILMDFMPWFLILALVLSAASHKVHRPQQVTKLVG